MGRKISLSCTTSCELCASEKQETPVDAEQNMLTTNTTDVAALEKPHEKLYGLLNSARWSEGVRSSNVIRQKRVRPLPTANG